MPHALTCVLAVIIFQFNSADYINDLHYPFVFVLDTEEGTVWSLNQTELWNEKGSFRVVSFEDKHKSGIESLRFLYERYDANDPLGIRDELEKYYDKNGNEITKEEFEKNEERLIKAKGFLAQWEIGLY